MKNPAAVSLGKIKTPKKAKSSAKNGLKAEEIRARLYINGIAEMSPYEFKGFIEWLTCLTKEFKSEKDLNIYNKRLRCTLYKPS